MKIKDLLLKTLDIYERGLEDFKKNKDFKLLCQKNLEFGLCNCFAGNVKVVNYVYFMKKVRTYLYNNGDIVSKSPTSYWYKTPMNNMFGEPIPDDEIIESLNWRISILKEMLYNKDIPIDLEEEF